MNLFKDYEIVGTRLYKFNLRESKHLLHNFGGVPAIDKSIWDKMSPGLEGITIKTDMGRTFRIDKEKFDEFKREIDYGFGAQYVVPINRWIVSSKQATLL